MCGFVGQWQRTSRLDLDKWPNRMSPMGQTEKISEHMFSALPPNSDIARWQLAFRIRANRRLINRSKRYCCRPDR
jgi:hypothetical protein